MYMFNKKGVVSMEKKVVFNKNLNLNFTDNKVEAFVAVNENGKRVMKKVTFKSNQEVA